MRVSASKTGLLASCQFWARPEAEWFDVKGPAAERGDRFHAAMDRYVQTGVREEVAEDIAAEYAVAIDWVEDFGRQRLRPEIAFAWDPATDTARELPSKGQRDYSGAHEGELCGTVDLVAVTPGGAGIVWDWKTGDASGAGPQLRTLAVMVARALRLSTVTVAALEVTAAGVREVCREDLDAFELDVHAGELAEKLAAIPTAEPTPGAHCSDAWCPARATCPEGREAAAQLVPVEALTKHRMSLQIDGPDHAAWMLDRVRLVEAACKATKEAIKAACPEEGWTLADGRTLREGTRKVERFKQAQAVALLRELGATDEQLATLWYEAEESAGLRVSGGNAKPARKRGKAAA